MSDLIHFWVVVKKKNSWQRTTGVCTLYSTYSINIHYLSAAYYDSCGTRRFLNEREMCMCVYVHK